MEAYTPPAEIEPAHEQPEVAPETFVCETCGREFSTIQGLGRHRGAAHKKRQTKKVSTLEPGASSELNRTRLVRTVFPTGSVPVGEVEALASWLIEAERLYGVRR